MPGLTTNYIITNHHFVIIIPIMIGYTVNAEFSHLTLVAWNLVKMSDKLVLSIT